MGQPGKMAQPAGGMKPVWSFLRYGVTLAIR